MIYKDIIIRKVKAGHVPLLVIKSVHQKQKSAGVLWIHGGGYFLGMKEMVFMSRAIDLVRKYHVTVVSPGYRLAFMAPYPAAIKDCYIALMLSLIHI